MKDDKAVRGRREEFIAAMSATEGIVAAAQEVKLLLPALENSKAAQRASDAVISAEEYVRKTEKAVAETRVRELGSAASDRHTQPTSTTSDGENRLGQLTAVAEHSEFASTRNAKALTELADTLVDGEQVTWLHTGSLMRKKLGVSAGRPGLIAVTSGRRLIACTSVGIEIFSLDDDIAAAVPRSDKKVVLHLADGSQRDIMVIQGGGQPLADAIAGPGTPMAPTPPAEATAYSTLGVSEPPTSLANADQETLLRTLKQLAELHESGVLSDEEFTSKKADLLARL